MFGPVDGAISTTGKRCQCLQWHYRHEGAVTGGGEDLGAERLQVLTEFFHSGQIHASMMAEPSRKTRNSTKYHWPREGPHNHVRPLTKMCQASGAPSTRRGNPSGLSSLSSRGSSDCGTDWKLTGLRKRRIAVLPTEVCSGAVVAG